MHISFQEFACSESQSRKKDMGSFRISLALSFISIMTLKSTGWAFRRDSTCNVQMGTGCDVFSDGTCCLGSTTVAVCIPDNYDGMNPSHWGSYTCPDADETCQYATADNEYGCVGVSSSWSVFFSSANHDQYPN